MWQNGTHASTGPESSGQQQMVHIHQARNEDNNQSDLSIKEHRETSDENLLVVGVSVVGLDHKQNNGLVMVKVMAAVVLMHSCGHAICILCDYIILGYAL